MHDCMKRLSVSDTTSAVIDTSAIVSHHRTIDLESLVCQLREQLDAAREQYRTSADQAAHLEEHVQRLKAQWGTHEIQRVEWGRQRALLSQKYVDLEACYEKQEKDLRQIQLGVRQY